LHGKDLLASFGHDLRIYENCDKNYESYSNLGWAFEQPSDIKYESIES
jgi:hypothetical protein